MREEERQTGFGKRRETVNFATYGVLLTTNQQTVGHCGHRRQVGERGAQVFAAGCTGWPPLCWGADGEPKLVVTLTFPLNPKSLRGRSSKAVSWRQKWGLQSGLAPRCQNTHNTEMQINLFELYARQGDASLQVIKTP